jgi:hypothetical protein
VPSSPFPGLSRNHYESPHLLLARTNSAFLANSPERTTSTCSITRAPSIAVVVIETQESKTWIVVRFVDKRKRSLAPGAWHFRGARKKGLLRWSACAVKRRLVHSGCESHPGAGSFRPVAIGAAVEVTKLLKPPVEEGRKGDSASVQAVT